MDYAIFDIGDKVERLSWSEKTAKDYDWFKKKARWVLTVCQYADLKKTSVNYDLVNNILDEEDFKYVVNPYNNPNYKLPARLQNRDIISTKVKVLEGMELKRPFVWRVVAVNPEATTRKEQKKAEMLRDFVVNSIMNPIIESTNQQYKQQIEQLQQDGSPKSQQQIQQLQAQIQEQVKAKTPPEVLKYMERDHQDPLEVMTNQILKYLMQEKDIKRKFNVMWKDSVIAGIEVGKIDIKHGEPTVEALNPKRFRYLKKSDEVFFENGEACFYEYDMTFNEIITEFGDELTEEEIRLIQEKTYNRGGLNTIDWDFDEVVNTDVNIGVSVYHCCWKSLREIVTLTYLDEEGKEQEMLVDENYKLDKSIGDIELSYEWIPEVYETYVLPNEIYLRKRPVPGQFRDMRKLHYSKLPYYGAVVDERNSQLTSIVDRMKYWQYIYNIVYFRIELLMASDRGKKLMMNINAIPDSAGIDIHQWQHFFDSTPFMFFNPNEEGMDGYSDVSTMAKEINLSTAQDLDKYVQLAEHIKNECKEAVGINDQMVAKISTNDAVSNTQAALAQGATLLEPYFALHDLVKRNMLTGLIEKSKVAFEDKEDLYLSYVLDDSSINMFKVDGHLFENASMGLYVQNSLKIEQIKDTLNQLSHAAMQNQVIKMSDVISIMKEEDLTQAEETMKAAEKRLVEENQQSQQSQQQHEMQMQEMMKQQEQQKHSNAMELVTHKNQEETKKGLAIAAMTGASFNPDTDENDNGINDYVEMARKIAETDIKKEALELQKEKFNHDKSIDSKKIELEKKKIAAKKTT